MRARRVDAHENEDLVTLWHVGGTRPCHGPALKVPPDFVDSAEAALPKGCELPDGSKVEVGSAVACGTCGEPLVRDFASQLALSRERYR